MRSQRRRAGRRGPDTGAECLLLHVGVPTVAVGFAGLLCHLRRHGVRAELLQVDEHRLEGLTRFRRAKLLAFSMHWHPQISPTLKLAEHLRALSAFRDAKVAVGGMTASAFARELLEFPFIDYVVQGDGEKPLLLLLRHLAEPARVPLRKVPNLWFREGDQGVASPLRFAATEKEIARLEREVVREPALFEKTAHVLSPGRGCRHGCLYCGGSNHAFRVWGGGTPRVERSVHELRRSIAAAVLAGHEELFLLGDNDGDCKLLAEAVGDRLPVRQLTVSAYGLPSAAAVRRLARAVAPSGGIVQIEISPEVADDANRRKVKATPFGNAALETLLDDTLASQPNLRYWVFFSYFLPGSTPWELEAREQVFRLSRKYHEAILRGRLVLFLDPLSTDPASALQRNRVPGFVSDAKSLADYHRALLGLRFHRGNFAAHRPEGMSLDEVASASQLFSFEGRVRTGFPYLYLNLVGLFSTFAAYHEFALRAFRRVEATFVRRAMRSSVFSHHFAYMRESLLGFHFTFDEAAFPEELLVFWLDALREELVEERRSQLAAAEAELFLGGGKLRPAMLPERFEAVLEQLELSSGWKAYDLAASGQKSPAFVGLLGGTEAKVRLLKERGLDALLVPARSPFLEVRVPRTDWLFSSGTVSLRLNLLLLGKGLLARLVGPVLVGGQSFAQGWKALLEGEAPEVAHAWTRLLLEERLPTGELLARLGAGQGEGELVVDPEVLSLEPWLGSAGADIRLVSFFLNHLARNHAALAYAPASRGRAFTLFFPEPKRPSRPHFVSYTLGDSERETLALADGTRTLRSIHARLPGNPREEALKDLFVSLYSRQMVY